MLGFPRLVSAPLAVSILSLALPASAQVAGTVVDDVSGTPIEGAIVTAQATDMRATTDASGAFELPGVPVGDVVVVGAGLGYYNGSARATAPATGVEIRLDSVPDENDPSHVLQSPQQCRRCHIQQFDEWRASPMAHGGVNTWVHDIYDGSGTTYGEGGFVYLRDSMHAAANPESECAACHQPLTWIASEPSAISPLSDTSEAVADGVSCVICHQIASIDLTQPNAPGIFAGVVTLTRPTDPTAQIMYGLLGDVDYLAPGQMRAAYNPALRSDICAACHQDANDPDGDHDFEEASSIISEPTYLEWLNSDYANPTSPLYATCIDCHMPTNDLTLACNVFLEYERQPGTLRSHTIEGTTATFLENAVSLSLDAQLNGAELTVDVSVMNDQTGHHVPTGVTIRNVVLLVEATLADGTALTHTGSQVLHELAGVGDPAEGYFAGLPGKLYAKFNHGEAGPGTGITFFTDATGITEDNRIGPMETDATSYTFDVPAERTMDVTVRARLIYRRSWRPLLDAKQWTEDGHGVPVEDLEAPHFGHLMEESTQVLSLGGDSDAGTGAADAGTAPPSSDGCGCRTAASGRVGPSVAFLLLCALGLRRRRGFGPLRSRARAARRARRLLKPSGRRR